MNTQKVISALKEALSELEKKEKTYKVGQMFKRVGGCFYGQVYLLSRVGPENRCVLINTKTGWDWRSKLVDVYDIQLVTEAEFREITDNKDFELVNEP